MTVYVALDTATDYASVAVGIPQRVAAELLVADRRHGTALAPSLARILEVAGVGWTDVSGIVVADGPGSFTGLRIGLATAKGLIRAYDHLELRVTPSLLGMAFSASAYVDGPVAAVYDALRNEVFGAVYRFDEAELTTVLEPTLLSPRDLADRCPVTPALAVGDGAVRHAEWAAAWTGKPPVGPPALTPRASALIELLQIAGATRVVESVDLFEPAYGRLAEAQVRWERDHGRALPGTERRRQ